MPDLTIAPLAREDLKDIGRYTQKTWGIPQRDAYLGAFTKVFEQVRIGAIKGRKRPEVKKSLLCYPCNKHVIFFRRDTNDNVEILRVLHQRMDVERHLGSVMLTQIP